MTRWSIRSLLIILVMSGTLPLVGVLSWSTYRDYQVNSETAETGLVNLAKATAADLQGFLDDAEAILLSVSSRPWITALDPRNCSPLFIEASNLLPRFTNLIIWDLSGRPLCGTLQLPDPEDRTSVVGRYWFDTVMRTESFTIGKPVLGQIIGVWMTVLSYPTYSADGSLAGVVTLSVDVERLEQVLGAATLPADGVASLLYSDGTIVARVPRADEFVGERLPETPTGDLHAALGSGVSRSTGIEGIDRVWGFATLPREEWRVYMGVPTDWVYGLARVTAYRRGLLSLGILLLVGALTWATHRYITRALHALVKGTQAAADGHHPHYLRDGPAEVVWVGEQLVRMMQSREATEEKLGAQEAYYRSLIENTADLITVIGPDGLVRYSSPAVRNVLGVEGADRIGRSSVELIHPEDREAFAERISASSQLDPGETLRWEGRVGHTDGSHRVIEAVGSAYVSAAGDRHTIVHARDVTDRVDIEHRLRVSEEWYRSFFDNALVGIGRIRLKDGRLTAANQRFFEIFGYETLDAALEHWRWAARAASKLELATQVAAADSVNLDATDAPFLRKDGTNIWLRYSGRVNTDEGWMDCFVEDRSREREVEMERAELDTQLQQAQKMQAIGQLTGGVAHDFNNLLTVILGNLELIEEDAHASRAVRDLSKSAAAAGDRAAALTQHLLAFARRQPLQPRALDLGELLLSMEDLLVRTIGEAIDVRFVSPDDLWVCEVDPLRLENAVLNLAINARDAMPAGGRLTIETANTTLDSSWGPDVEAGNYVLLDVTDSGEGMSPEVLQHAFEPFYTTKDVGRGSGLGLSMVYGFAKQSEGHASIHSEVGHGTSVRLYFPMVTAEVEHLRQRTSSTEIPRGAGEVVLVVEDDEGVLDLTLRFLSRLGYEAIPVMRSAEALRILEERSDIDMVFTDVVLPGGMSGPDLAREVGRRWPDVRVLYSSGYTEDAIPHPGRLDPGVNLVEKPFRLEVLARMLRRVLDE